MSKRRTLTLARDPQAMALDIVSYGRRGPSAPNVLSASQVAQVERTVRGAPEVIVKVSGGGKEVGAVKAHFEYIDRHGKLEIETDDGQLLKGKGAADELLRDWNLDVAGVKRVGAASLRAPKMVHNIVLSMPAQSPPEKVLKAAQHFAREQFALKHRYAMVLHTDTAHPHVHLVVKAKSEEGKRLYIRKATLRDWREDFARALREQGLEANATPRAIRGKANEQKSNGIFWAMKRGESTHVRDRVATVAEELQNRALKVESGKSGVIRTRREVLQSWQAVNAALIAQGETPVAGRVANYVSRMPPPMTEKERLAAGLMKKITGLRERHAKRQELERGR